MLLRNCGCEHNHTVCENGCGLFTFLSAPKTKHAEIIDNGQLVWQTTVMTKSTCMADSSGNPDQCYSVNSIPKGLVFNA